MATYAQVVGGTVQSLIIAETWEDADSVAWGGVESVEVTTPGVGIGWTYVDGEFTPPEQPDPEETP